MDEGFTTRAIRAATRVPRVGQPPSSVPIYQATTHRQLTPAELADAGIAPGLLRISVGLEDAADVRADVERALAGARAAVEAAAANTAPA